MTDRFEQALIAHCSPTLAGIKPANLFSYRMFPGEDVEETLGEGRRFLYDKGIDLRILRKQQRAALVYLYRRKELSGMLSLAEHRAFLAEQGYADFLEPETALMLLARRFAAGPGFPHEVGLFLGYPLEDVIGFIQHKGENCHRVGFWKVYSDPEAAQGKFQKFTKCIAIYQRMFREGKSLLQLTVSA